MRDHKQAAAVSQKDLHHQATTSERSESEMVQEAEKEMEVATDPVERLKLRCLANGVTGVLDFGRMFRNLGYKGDQCLNFQEFSTGINKTGLDLSDVDQTELFNLLDEKKRGLIDIGSLMSAARSHLSHSRLKVIREAFNKLDHKGDGCVTTEDIKQGFCVEHHPRFVVGDESKEHIVAKFIDNFQTADGTWNGSLTEEEFMNYYAGVSPTIDEDGFFDLMIRQTFKLDHSTEKLYHETQSTKREEEMMDESLSEVDSTSNPIIKVRSHCLLKGVTGILLLGRLFRHECKDGEKLDLNEFVNCLNKAGVEVNSGDAVNVFNSLEKDDEGRVNVSSFLEAVRPPLSAGRMHLIRNAFKKLDRTGDGVLTKDDFKHGFCVDHHPRYVVGVESRDEIIDKFLQKFETADHPWDGKVTEDEFVNYYAVESATINDDCFFDLMMRQSFKL